MSDGPNGPAEDGKASRAGEQDRLRTGETIAPPSAEKARIDEEMRIQEARRAKAADQIFAVRERRDPKLVEFDYLLLVCCIGAAAWDEGATIAGVMEFAETWNIDLGAVENTVQARLAKLEAYGLLVCTLVPGQRGAQRREYGPDGDAVRLVRESLLTPVALPVFDRELFVRLLGEMAGPLPRVTAGLLPLNGIVERKLRQVERSELVAQKAARFSPGLQLAYDLEKTLLHAYLEWLRRALKVLPKVEEVGARPQMSRSRCALQSAAAATPDGIAHASDARDRLAA